MQETLKQLQTRGDQAAIINQQEKSISYSELYDLITKFSSLLSDIGITKNSRVVILASLDWPLYGVLASCFQLGATVVLVDPWASSEMITKSLSQVNPDTLIISKKACIFLLKKAIRGIPKRIILEHLLENKTNSRLTQITHVEPDQTALITFTSGTTGTPKGFDRSHEFLSAQQEAHDEYFGHSAGEIDLTMYPVFVLSNLKSGMTSVLIKGNLRKIDSIKIHELYQQIIKFHVESMTLSPVILDKLITYCETQKLNLPLKKIYTGGAPVPQELCARITKLNPQIEAYVVYGSTEAEPIALIPMKDVSMSEESLKLGTPLGKIVSALKSDLLPIEGKIHPYHQGRVGEVTLTGKFVGKKYWNNEKAFKENKWIDDQGLIWHKTGDVVLEKDGLLYMIGRRSNGMQTPHGLLYPVPVENQIDLLSGVTKAAYFELNGKMTLAYSGEKTAKPLIENLLKKQNLPFDQVLRIKNMPMDSRHRSKIDLPTLKTKLS